MTIPIQQEEENYTTHIETRVHAGVIIHKIKFESLSVGLELMDMDGVDDRRDDSYEQRYDEDGEATV